ncbi:MAG: hypothetical protein ACKVIH_05630 [Burkholderiales bacterium]
MDWNAYLDLYCERLAPGLWGEPLNALSNGAFWLAALWLWWLGARLRSQARQTGGSHPATHSADTATPTPLWHWELDLLLVLLVLVGAASALFHTFATRWAVVLDAGFIALYLHSYVAVYAHRVMHIRWRWAWLGVPVFFALNQFFSWLWDAAAPALGALIQSLSGQDATAWNRGATGYLAAWTVLLLLAAHSSKPSAGGVLASKVSPAVAVPLWCAAGVFLISLTLRQLDLPLCSQWRWGTHFAWHLLNALTLGLTAYALLQTQRRVDTR